jgi:hypothetical protein
MWSLALIDHISEIVRDQKDEDDQAGAYTRPLVGSTWAIFVTETTQRVPQEVPRIRYRCIAQMHGESRSATLRSRSAIFRRRSSRRFLERNFPSAHQPRHLSGASWGTLARTLS